MNDFDNQGFGLEAIVAEAREKFNGILEFSLSPKCLDSQGTEKCLEPHRFERRLFQMLLELGRIFLRIFFMSFGKGDLGREISNEKGETLKRYRIRAFKIGTVVHAPFRRHHKR
jgi:hypothetical protein